MVERGVGEGRSLLWLRTRRGPVAGRAELVIADLREEDEGEYTCVIANSLGAVSHTIAVRTERRVVVGSPEIQVWLMV